MRNAPLLLALAGLVVACDDPGAEPGTGDAGASPGMVGASQDSGANSDAGAVSNERGLPCDVQAALDAKCGTCHAAPTPLFGAPMSLSRADDFQAHARLSGTPVHEAAKERIERTTSGMMPPSTSPQLTDEERTSLLSWLSQGAPEAATGCATSDAGTSADGGVGADAAAGNEDCELGFELRASTQGGGGFPVPLEDDRYECFYFKAELDADALATSLTPIIDESRVLHHWLLFASNQEEAPSGTHRSCNGIHANAYMMAGWAPGTGALVLPADVGMEMPNGPAAQYILEMHYNNTARHAGVLDRSGVRVCATKEPKRDLAGIHWLGSEVINLSANSEGAASSTCTPSGSDPIHILAVMPHMHTLGTHAKMTILRSNGTTEPLHDSPFEFENQTWYSKDAVLQPGDRVASTCSYHNTTGQTVTLGEATGDEMCYLFTLAYPVGRMNTGGDLRIGGNPIIPGPNRCMR